MPTGNLDAQVWADEWLKTLEANPDIAKDKATMTGWFANAIMTGYDKGHRNEEVKSQALAERCFEMEAAMVEFVKRCEAGEIRSKRTYERFKNILDKFKESEHNT